MNNLHSLVALVVIAALTCGVPLLLYVLLTRKQRAALGAIREGTEARGWKFRARHWTGNPSAFRIDGRNRSGLRVTLKSGAARGYDPGWNATLKIKFPDLAGEPDVAVLPRSTARDSGLKMRGVSSDVQAKVAAFSGLAASAIRLMREGKETPTGFAAFDKTYQVSSLGVSWQPLVDARLAERIIAWPNDVVALHTLLAWRDPSGFSLEARLPAPPNWATICYVVALAENLSARLPAGRAVAQPKGIFDQFVTGILGKR
jgi:hypothetical protein